MKRKFKAGLTSVSLPVFIADTSSTTGGGLSGVTSASSGLVLEYRRAGQSSWTSVTPVSGKTLGTYLSGGIVADGSLAGAYEVDFPDAAFASGVRMVVCRIRGVTNMLPVLIEIELDAVDYQDSTAFGLSRLASAGTAGSVGTGVTLAGVTHTGATIPTVTTVGSVSGAVGSVASFGSLVSDITTSVWSAASRTLSATGVQAIWDALTSGLTTTGSIGKWIIDNLNTTVSSRASQASVNAIPTNPLLTTDSRLNNLDFAISTVNNNILNLNNLSAKMNLFGSPLLEIPESGSTVYAFTLVVKDDEDKLVNLDANPTVTAANAAGTNRSANLSAVSNPSTGRYTFTYTVANTHASESLRIAVSGTVSAEARYVEWIGAVVNYDSLTVLQSVQTTVNAIDTRLPAAPAAVGDIPTANQNRDAVMNAMPNGGWTAGSFGDRWIISNNSNRTIGVTGSGSGHVQCDVHAFQPGVIDAAAIADNAIDAGSIAAGALNGKGDWLTTLGANAPANWINAAAIATDAIDSDAIAASAVNKITVNLFKYGDIQLWTSPANQIQVTITKV